MIKKYFALSLIATSVFVAGCSSDDDDNGDSVDVTPVEPVEPAVVATPGVGGSSFDSIANSPDHATLRAAIEAAGLADALDNPANSFTIFAPTDAAFAALDGDGDDTTPTSAELLEPGMLATLQRVLQYHVLSGDVTSTALSELVTSAGDSPAVANTLVIDGDTTQTLAFTSSDASPTGLAVNGVSIDQADVVPAGEDATQGLVHVIGTILMPPAAPEVVAPVEPETPVDPGTPGTPVAPAGGAVQTALESSGNFSSFLSGFGANYGLQKLDAETDGDPWTVFAPTNAALAGADVVVNDHIAVGGKLLPADLLAAGTFTSFTGNSYPVGGTVDALTVGGFPVSVAGGGAGATITYTIGGVLD